MDRLMLRLAEFVVTQASTDYIEVWNSWINTGINIPQGAMPTLLAVIRELVLIDQGTLKEVIRVEKNQNYGIYDPSVFYNGR